MISKKIKHTVLVPIASFVFVLFLFWCFCFKMISPGYVGVIVDLFGNSKGVEEKELHVGMHWVSPWKTVYEFPIFEQNTTWEKKEGFNFQTSEGMALSADIGITFHLKPDCIHIIFQKYRRGMDEITHTFVRNFVRDAINTSASKMKIEDLYGEGKERFFDTVEQHVREQLKDIGIELSRIYLIGRFQFPQNVIAALNAKIEATQRAQQRENELREAEAQAKKNIAEADGQAKSKLIHLEMQAKAILITAEAEARANLILSKSITDPLIKWQSIQKWNGQLPKVTGNAIPMIQIDTNEKD